MEEIKIVEKTPISKSQPQVVKPLTSPPAPSSFNLGARTLVIFLILILLGAGTGYAIYAKQSAGTVRLAGRDVQVVKTSNEEGVKDASTYKDTTTGLLKENDGKLVKEGSHILVRGDVSQNAYLTSSVIDLSKYVGKKVQVWGETYKGQQAGWLMDVGRIKVL